MTTYLLDTKTNTVITDAIEIVPGVWVHEDNRNICTDAQIGDGRRFRILDEKSAMKIPHKTIIPEKQIKQDMRITQDEVATRQNILECIIPRDDTMPLWFTEYIKKYSVEGGKQTDIRNTYDYDEKDWIEYLCDSSFPSTYIAGYKIVKNLLENTVVATSFADSNELLIADIGCGNGGATIGAITAIYEILPNINKITIEAYDYNENALKIFKDCIDAYPKIGQIEVGFKTIQLIPQTNKTNENAFTLEGLKRLLQEKSYDFILCFKMINELIFNHKFPLRSTYFQFFNTIAPLLSVKGFLVVLDVYKSAEKDDNGKYLDENEYGKELNKQGRQFVKENEGFKSIIPIPCALVEGGCDDRGYCSQQRLFKAKDGRAFPATYKVITRKKFAEEILKSVDKGQTSEYIIQETKTNGKRHCNNNGYNVFSKLSECICCDEDSYRDGFELN